ncbi:MAG: DUF167 domain-containing protein [Patescibacteria group bacterium]
MFIKVKVFPDSKSEDIIKKAEDSFEVHVKEKPVMGRANIAVIGLLSYYFEVPREKVRLVKGFKERNKIFEIK